MPQVNVLVVDDEPSIRTLLAVVLGIEKDVDRVLVTERGDEAIEACRAFSPDVLITDSLLPGMSGREVADGVREAHPDVKVILFTGLDDDPEWADASVGKGTFDAIDRLRRLVLGNQGYGAS